MSAQRTSLTLRDARADLLAELLRRHADAVLTLEDIARIPTVARWGRALDIAIADLVVDGRLVDDAYGRIHVVAPRAEA